MLVLSKNGNKQSSSSAQVIWRALSIFCTGPVPEHFVLVRYRNVGTGSTAALIRLSRGQRLSPLFSLVFHRAAVLVQHWRGLTFGLTAILASFVCKSGDGFTSAVKRLSIPSWSAEPPATTEWNGQGHRIFWEGGWVLTGGLGKVRVAGHWHWGSAHMCPLPACLARNAA